MKTILPFSLVCLVLLSPAKAQTSYTWTSSTTGGSWSTSSDWTVVSGSGTTFPVVGDTATFGNAGVNRTVTYNYAAAESYPTGRVLTLNFTQATSGVVNELDLNISLAVGTPLTLSATGGTSEILLDTPTTGTTAVELSPTPLATIGSGGNITISGYSSAVNVPNVGSVNEGGAINSNLTLSGGTLVIDNGLSAGYTIYGVFGALTLNSGAITFGGGSGTSTDNRLIVDGNFSMSGGTVNPNSVGSLYLYGSTNTITGGTLNAVPIVLESTTSPQTLASSVALGNVSIVGSISSTIVTDTATGNNIGAITLVPSSGGPFPILELGSNFKSTAQLVGGSPIGSIGLADLTLDTAGHTLDLTASGSNFAPNNVGTGINTGWVLESSTGSGLIKAAGFTLSGAYQVTVENNVTLQATSAGTNDLSGNLIMYPSSTFLYTGAGTATLKTGNFGIGQVQVQSGILQINGANTSTYSVTVQSGATLDIVSGNLDASGTITNNGTLVLGSGVTLNSTGTFTNNGTLDLTNDPSFTLPGNFVNTGTVLMADTADTPTLPIGGVALLAVLFLITAARMLEQRKSVPDH